MVQSSVEYGSRMMGMAFRLDLLFGDVRGEF